VSPRAVLEFVERRKILSLPGLELRPLGRQPVASRYTHCAILALKENKYLTKNISNQTNYMVVETEGYKHY
jgi:hypothetical protein